MAISNTSILIKRSLTTGRPVSAQQGEFAYSYASNTLFIGTPGGNGVVNVGGQYYTSTLDSATSANTASTLVKRDASGAFSGQLYGNSNTASYLQTPQNFSISGGDITASTQSFGGTNAVTLNASLNSITGLTAGYYGGSTSSGSTIPVVQVAANGRIMSIANTSVSSSFNISDGTNSKQIQSGNTFYHLGTSGVITTVSQNTVTFSTDNTVARTNTTSVGPQTFLTDINLPTNNMSVGGTLYVSNLSVSGNVNYANVTSTLNIGDPMIYLASNNSSDLVDIGFVGHIVGTGSSQTSHYQHLGFVRDYNDRKWKLFSNVSPEPSSTVVFDANTIYDVIKVGGVDVSGGDVLSANLLSTSTLIATKANTTNDLAVGGNAYIAGGISFTTANATYVNVSSGIVSYGPYAGPYVDGTVLDYTTGVGRLTVGASDGFTIYNGGTGARNALLAINSSGNITTGTWTGSTIGVAYGGTGNTTFAPSGILIGNGTGALQTLSNTSSSGTYGSASYLPVVTVDGYGRVSSVSNTAIGIDQSQVTTGIFPIARGGTNNNTFTNNTLTFFNGTSVVSLANVSYTATGTGGTGNTLTSITVDNFGRASAVTFAPISGLTVSQGGTGASNITQNGVVFGNGAASLGVTAVAGISDQTWSNQILTVTNAGVPVWSSAMDGGSF